MWVSWIGLIVNNQVRVPGKTGLGVISTPYYPQSLGLTAADDAVLCGLASGPVGQLGSPAHRQGVMTVIHNQLAMEPANFQSQAGGEEMCSGLWVLIH